MGDLVGEIGDWIATKFCELLYLIGRELARIVSYAYDIFRVFSGTEKVTNDGTDDYLINIFFSNSAINKIYMIMALIGVAMCIGFTVAAVVKKMTDVDDKMHTSLGGILRKMFTSIVTIFLVHFFLVFSIQFANTLMASIEYLFNNAESIGEATDIEFTTDQYATMARICDTIGNYSLNDSAKSRYNLNSCYNEIRNDMLHLEDTGVFYFTYEEFDENKDQILSVPYLLTQIARARNLSEPMLLKDYDEAVSTSILNTMDYLKKNSDNIYTMKSYHQERTVFTSDNMDLGVVMFLAAATNAARDSKYNGASASYSDPIRSPYVTGTKNVYDIDQVEQDFDLSFSKFNHLILIIGCVIMLREFLMLIIDCVARLFNLLLLYLAAPPFIATSPLDEGAKFKQWTVAFVVQCFNIFGTVIALRLLMLFCPIVFNSNLIILNGGFIGTLAKMLLVVGAVYGARKSSGIISGILADSAGWQSINAGDASSSFRRGVFGRAFDRTKARVSNELWGKSLGGAKALAKAAGISLPMAIGRGIGRKALGAVGVGDAGRRAKFNDRMEALKRTNPARAREEATQFLGMNKDTAKSLFGMNDKQYGDTFKELSRYAYDKDWNMGDPAKDAADKRSTGKGGSGGGSKQQESIPQLFNQVGANPDGTIEGLPNGFGSEFGEPDYGNLQVGQGFGEMSQPEMAVGQGFGEVAQPQGPVGQVPGAPGQAVGGQNNMFRAANGPNRRIPGGVGGNLQNLRRGNQ